jgi:hypothetical protein
MKTTNENVEITKIELEKIRTFQTSKTEGVLKYITTTKSDLYYLYD